MSELTWKSICCRKGGCPEVAVDEKGLIYIKDDHGGQVKLTPDELDNILYILAKNEMEKEAAVCCGGHCVHTFTDENGLDDYTKRMVKALWENVERDEVEAIKRMTEEDDEC
jgi:hypothetical protein